MRKVLISAHSGGSGQSRSVTYEHFERALKSGAEYVELDVRRTADGVLIAYHDARLAEGGASVARTEYRDLEAAAGYPIPRVEEVLHTLAGKAIGHLDLKDTEFEHELVVMASDILRSGNFIVTSLEDASVARIKDQFPEARTALSLGRDVEELAWPQKAAVRFNELRPLSRIKACRADWVAVNYKLARLGVLGQCERHHLGVMVWTVNSPRLIDRFLADPRVDVLITDHPEYAVRRRDGVRLT